MPGIIDGFWVALGFKTDTEGLKDFKQKADGVKASMMAVGAVVAGAAAGITALVHGAVEKLAGIQEFANITEMTARSVAALGKVATENGGSLEAMEGTIRSLTVMTGLAARGVGRAAMVFKQLGLHAKDATGRAKDFDAILGDVADMMQGKTRTEQLGIAAKLGIDEHLIELLSQGKEKLAALRAEAEASNPLTPEDYANALKTERQFVKLRMAMASVRNQIAVALLPTINEGVKAFTAWFKENRATTVKRITAVLRELAGVLMFVVRNIDKVGFALTAFAAYKVGAQIFGASKAVLGLVKALGGLKAALDMGGLLALLVLVAEDLYTFATGGDSLTGLIIEKLQPSIVDLVEWLGLLALAFGLAGAPIYGVIAAGVALVATIIWVGKHWDEIVEGMKASWRELVDAIEDSINTVTEAMGLGAMFGGTYKERNGALDENIKRNREILRARRAGMSTPNSQDMSTSGDATPIAGVASMPTPSAYMSFAPPPAGGAGGNVTSTQVTQTTTVGTVNIVTNDPKEMEKEFNRRVIRNGQKGYAY